MQHASEEVDRKKKALEETRDEFLVEKGKLTAKAEELNAKNVELTDELI